MSVTDTIPFFQALVIFLLLVGYIFKGFPPLREIRVEHDGPKKRLPVRKIKLKRTPWWKRAMTSFVRWWKNHFPATA